MIKAPTPPRQSGLAQRVARLWSGKDNATPWLPKDARYPRLLAWDAKTAGAVGQSGLYACWHLGVRPRWLRVGGAGDLTLAIMQLQKRAEIVRHEANGGVFIAWAVLPVAQQAAAVGYLAEHLKPVCQTLALAGEMAPILPGVAFPFPPGTVSTSPSNDMPQS